MNITKQLLYKFIAPMFIILFLLSFASCTAQKKPNVQSDQRKVEEKEPPKELDKLKDSIKKVEKALEAIYEENQKPMFIQQEKLEKQASEDNKQGEGGQENQSGEKSSSSGGSSDSESGGSSSGGQEQTQAQKLTPEQLKLKLDQDKYKKFESIKKDVLGLHSAWNSYEAKAIADFASQSAINDFESALNNLTKTSEAQDVYQSLLEVNQLYKYLPDFYMLYESKVPPELDKLRFAIKKIQLLSERKNYTGTNDVLLYFENIWMSARPKLKSDNTETVTKFEFAFADLKNAVIAKNDMIIKAKAEVMMKLIDEIEKKAEKESK